MDIPVSNLNREPRTSLGGTSSDPKEKAQPASLMPETDRSCPETRSPISSVETVRTEESKLSERFFKDAISLMRAFPCNHPLVTDNTSSRESEIMALAFLLNCDENESSRWLPFFKNTLLVAEIKRR
jgi:hypothetical protein